MVQSQVQLIHKVSERSGERALLIGSLEYTCQWKILVSYSRGGGGGFACLNYSTICIILKQVFQWQLFNLFNM